MDRVPAASSLLGSGISMAGGLLVRLNQSSSSNVSMPRLSIWNSSSSNGIELIGTDVLAPGAAVSRRSSTHGVYFLDVRG